MQQKVRVCVFERAKIKFIKSETICLLKGRALIEPIIELHMTNADLKNVEIK